MTKDEALKLALKAMEYADACLKKQLTMKYKHEYAQDLLLEAGTAIKEALAQPEQEPVAWKLMPRDATDSMLKAMDECSTEGYDERLYAGHAASVYMAAWDEAPTPPQPEQEPTTGNILMDSYKAMQAKKLTAQPEQEPVAHSVIAGALFDFMGWLTSRKERIVLSSADEASPAVYAIRDFAKMRGLSLDDAKVQDWQDMARGSNAP